MIFLVENHRLNWVVNFTMVQKETTTNKHEALVLILAMIVLMIAEVLLHKWQIFKLLEVTNQLPKQLFTPLTQ